MLAYNQIVMSKLIIRPGTTKDIFKNEKTTAQNLHIGETQHAAISLTLEGQQTLLQLIHSKAKPTSGMKDLMTLTNFPKVNE